MISSGSRRCNEYLIARFEGYSWIIYILESVEIGQVRLLSS